MKKTLSGLIILFFAVINIQAQSNKELAQGFLDSADIYFAQEDYWKSYRRYNAANNLASFTIKFSGTLKKRGFLLKSLILSANKYVSSSLDNSPINCCLSFDIFMRKSKHLIGFSSWIIFAAVEYTNSSL